MIRTQIYIPEPIHQAAKILARQKEEYLAELLRRLIIRGLVDEKRKMTIKSLASLTRLNITGGPKDLSKNLDKYIYKNEQSWRLFWG